MDINLPAFTALAASRMCTFGFWSNDKQGSMELNIKAQNGNMVRPDNATNSFNQVIAVNCINSSIRQQHITYLCIHFKVLASPLCVQKNKF